MRGSESEVFEHIYEKRNWSHDTAREWIGAHNITQEIPNGHISD